MLDDKLRKGNCGTEAVWKNFKDQWRNIENPVFPQDQELKYIPEN
jgi:hypothetical protein